MNSISESSTNWVTLGKSLHPPGSVPSSIKGYLLARSFSPEPHPPKAIKHLLCIWPKDRFQGLRQVSQGCELQERVQTASLPQFLILLNV